MKVISLVLIALCFALAVVCVAMLAIYGFQWVRVINIVTFLILVVANWFNYQTAKLQGAVTSND